MDEKANLPVTDSGPGQTATADDQVTNRMQRLNLYFEKENVRTLHDSFSPFFLKKRSKKIS